MKAASLHRYRHDSRPLSRSQSCPRRPQDLKELRALTENADGAQRLAFTPTWERSWQIAPVPFHPQLLEFCDHAILETCGRSHRLPSGPLHDATEVSRSGIPTVMMFVQSLHGISHNKIEDTHEDHLLLLCVQAFDA